MDLCAAVSLQATRGQELGPQESIKLDDHDLVVPRADGRPADEEGVHAVEWDPKELSSRQSAQ